MPADLHVRAAIDRLVTTVRSRWEEDLRVCAAELAMAAETDCQHAVDEAVAASAAAVQQSADSRIEEIRTLLDATERAKALSDEALLDVQRELHETRRELTDALARLETTQHAADAASADQSRMAEAGALWVLSGAARNLDEARSLGDVLDCLTHAARRIVPDTAVYLVIGDYLHEWSPSRGLEHPAMTTKLWPSRADAEGDEGFFAVRVGGAVVAVVNVDSPPADDPARSWSGTLGLLTRHAGLVLESMTFRRSAGLADHGVPVAAYSVASVGVVRS